MFRCFSVTVGLVLAIAGQSAAQVNIWLSGIGIPPPGSVFPPNASAVPEFRPYLGGSGTIYIWGRPDPAAGTALENVSLNLVSDSPGTISFTNAIMYNPSFGGGRRFEFVDDSSGGPPTTLGPPVSTCSDPDAELIAADRICGLEGVTVFNNTGPTAVGIGSTSDPYHSAPSDSWLIAAVDYDVLATGENTETRLYLEIGEIGMNHVGDLTDDCDVIFGDAMDTPALNAEDDRGEPSGNYDALIRPRPLPGDADRNGVVQPADHDLWSARFGQTTQLSADHNGNMIMDAADYAVWRKFLGASAGAGGASGIPEPPAAVLTIIALTAFLAVLRLSPGRSKEVAWRRGRNTSATISE
jgi:hypothetical protein